MTGTIGQYQRHLAQFANGNLGSAFTFDLHVNGIYQSGVLNAATVALSFTNPRVHTTLFVELIQDSTGGRAATFSGSVVGTPPPLNTAPNASTLLELVYNGTNYQFVSVPAAAGTSLTSAAPVNVTKAAAAVGTATAAARADHKHDVTTAPAVSVGAANAEGTAASVARSDHTHAVTDFALAGQSQGDISFFNGSNWVRLAAGIAGKVLQTMGGAANPIWAAVVALTASAPVNVTKAAADAGTATDAARSDHKHDVTTAPAVSVGSSNSEGTSAALARADHTHAVTSLSFTPLALATAAPGNVTKAAAAVGTATDAARSDHKHDVTTAAAVAVGAANAEGAATTLARSDHTHAVNDLALAGQARGDLASFNGSNWVRLAAGIAGRFLQTAGPGADPFWAAVLALTASAPVNVTKSAAAVGTATDAARSDHKHDVSTAAAVTISTTNAEGTATTLARSDHTHNVSLSSSNISDASSWGAGTITAALDAISSAIDSANAAISALSSSVTAALNTLNRFSLQGATSQAYSLLAADAGWTFFPSQGWVGNATGASITFSLGPYPSGCTVDTVQISYRPSAFGSTHGTNLPLNQPTLTLFVFNTAAGATAHSVTDSAGSVAAYETVRTLTLSSLGIPAGVPMWLQLTDESGIHAQSGNQLGRVTVTFD